MFGVLTHGVAGARTSRVSTDLATPRRAPLTARISPYTVRVIVRSMNRYTISFILVYARLLCKSVGS